MKQYLDIMREIKEKGIFVPDRTGTGTFSLDTSAMMKFNLQEGFPLVTTKKVSLKNIFTELMWFIRGDTRISTLVQQGNNIWVGDWKRINRHRFSEEEMNQILADMKAGKEFPADVDNLPEIYGKQWRDWDGVDQLSNLLRDLELSPYSRRHILTAWNPPKIPDMALPPCHTLSQFTVREGHLNCALTQRSGDHFLGVPYNIASYSMFTMMIARHVGLEPGTLTHVINDAHLYKTHFEAVDTQLSREPRPLPKLILNSEKDVLFDWNWEDLQLEGYNPHPAIRAPLEVG
jgi:thymidylate synthase